MLPLRALLTLSAGFLIGANAPPQSQRSIFWPQTLSLVLPGFDQWWEGEYGKAATYSGTALTGLAYASHNLRPDARYSTGSLSSQSRKYYLGRSVWSLMGELSAYDSFRMAAATRPEDFSFIKASEPVQELAWSPFQFRLFLRPTTYLALAAKALFWQLVQTKPFSRDRFSDRFTGEDVLYSGTRSFQAAVGEEAMFRGWIMPVAAYYSSPNVANLTQAALFGAAHYQESKILSSGFPQFLSGLYYGWLVQRSDYSMQEAVFAHFWWDVYVFLGQYSRKRKSLEAYYLPLGAFVF